MALSDVYSYGQGASELAQRANYSANGNDRDCCEGGRRGGGGTSCWCCCSGGGGGGSSKDDAAACAIVCLVLGFLAAIFSTFYVAKEAIQTRAEVGHADAHKATGDREAGNYVTDPADPAHANITNLTNNRQKPAYAANRVYLNGKTVYEIRGDERKGVYRAQFLCSIALGLITAGMIAGLWAMGCNNWEFVGTDFDMFKNLMAAGGTFLAVGLIYYWITNRNYAARQTELEDANAAIVKDLPLVADQENVNKQRVPMIYLQQAGGGMAAPSGLAQFPAMNAQCPQPMLQQVIVGDQSQVEGSTGASAPEWTPNPGLIPVRA